MFIVKASKWDHDENFHITKKCQQHFYEFRDNTLKGAMLNYKDMRDNNDMRKYTPITIYDIVNTAEE